MSEPVAKLRGIILAAGFGTRLAPLTSHVPKSLLPVGGLPLIDHAAASMVATGIRDIAVNTHHLGDLVQAHLQTRPDLARFAVFPEAEILGTGGALDGARGFLGAADHFLVHNGDVLCNADLGALLADHLASGALATLLLVDWPPVNSVAVDLTGVVRRIGGDGASDDPGWHRLTYTGIGVFRRELLDDIGPGFSSLIDPLVRAKNSLPCSVRGFAPDRLTWSDLGTPARYLVGLDGDEVSPEGILQVRRITGHGSQRRFWRLSGVGFSFVAMVSPADDLEFDRFCAIGQWLHAEGLGGPEVLAVHAEEKSVLMEDVGPASLFSLAGSDQASRHYEQVVDHLLQLQQSTDRARAFCPSATDRTLDHSMLRWETDYFRKRFLAGHCRLAASVLAKLTPEFEDLAKAVARQPLTLIHRDFQSQNIHLQNGRVRLLDFQGMRLGPLGYDIMSLVMDPYMDLPSGLKRRLVDRFCLSAAGENTAEEVRAMTVTAGLQRIMQALGAYGYLGHVLNKPAFLEHIPRAMAHLRILLAELEQISAKGGERERRWLPSRPLTELTGLVAGWDLSVPDPEIPSPPG